MMVDQVIPMKHRHEALIDYPVVTTIPLLWGDHDAFGHVNNLVYLRWCETARAEAGSAAPAAGAAPLADSPRRGRAH